jgi:hypothetical protein
MDWVLRRVSNAREATQATYPVPNAVADLAKELLSTELQHPLKAAELRSIVHRLAAANRGTA